MITADKLQELIQLDRQALVQMLAKSGHKNLSFKKVDFIGFTNGKQFCYKVTHFDEVSEGKEAVSKVFVTYNPVTGSMFADLS